MEIKNISNHQELQENIQGKEKAYLLLYKSGSETSECALKNLTQASSGDEKTLVLIADTQSVRDIHEKYNITSVPTLITFEKGDYKNTFKGCHEDGFYKNIFTGNTFVSKSGKGEEKAQKRVTVYTTPTCSWCITLKRYLDQNGIKYREVNIAADQKQAEALVKRSGQQGVPQTDIDGTIIVGFDKPKINRMLDIRE